LAEAENLYSIKKETGDHPSAIIKKNKTVKPQRDPRERRLIIPSSKKKVNFEPEKKI